MKKFLTTAILLAMFTTWPAMMAQPYQEEYLGLPGDNLNLYAVMKLFQESATLESFERNLNDENTRINNLDLNGDNLIDYIRVTDYADRDVHNIVLQVAINSRENQDVAVFTVQRIQNGQVQIQLIGDETLYGKNYIIEPIYDEQYANQTPNPGYNGNVTAVRTTYYDIAAWPLVRFIFMPNYVVWRSDWHWGYYPTYWHPWQPYYWHFYYGYHYNWYNNYYSHYHRYDHPRYSHWNDFYYSNRRSHSPYVSERIHSGHYRTTYSHPDQRSKGEALYARTNHDQINRRAVQSSDNRTTRRAESGTNSSLSTTRRSSTQATRSTTNPVTERNTGSARRSANTGKEGFATTRTNERNTSTAKRSTANVNTRTATPAATTNNASTARKSSSNASTRSGSTQPKSYNSTSERRSGSTMGNRPASNPKPAQNNVQSRSTSKHATSVERSSSRRSSGQSQSVKSSKSSNNKNSNETTKSSKRR